MSHPKQVSDTLFLDGIRGFAAFYVMVGHCRWLLWEGYSLGYLQHPEQYNWFETLWVHILSAFRYGHEAVLLFFVLSGFVIHLRYANQFKNNIDKPFDTLDFFKRRIKRIYPPLLLAILLTFILDSIGLWLQLPVYSHQTAYDTINNNIDANHQLTTLLGNLAFLMKIYVPIFGSNGALWSLAYEWWFYMIYPLFYLIIRKSFTMGTMIVILAYLSCNLVPHTPKLAFEVFSFFPIWWLGALLAEIYAERIRLKFQQLIPLTLLLIIAPITPLNLPLRAANQLIWGLGFTGLFALFFHLQNKGFKLSFITRLKPLGDISYSLYVIHFPIVVFISGLLLKQSTDFLLPQSMIYIFIGVITSVIIAIGAFHLVEKPFIKKKHPSVKQF